MQAYNDKLNLFEQKIMRCAELESEEILREAQQLKQSALEQEENTVLEALHREMRTQVTELRAQQVREISQEAREMKKALYEKREQLIDTLLDRARVQIDAFVLSGDYQGFLLKKIGRFAAEFPAQDAVISVCPRDIALEGAIRAAYGPCKVQADETILLGGAVLRSATRGIELDESLDTALLQQRDWFYNQSGFYFE